MKRFLLAIIIALAACMPGKSVLKEKDLNHTIVVLRAELENAFLDQKEKLKTYDQRVKAQHMEMIQVMQRSHQISLMLYSQKVDYTFDITYTCHEATEMYRNFKYKRLPYDKILTYLNGEIARYDALISALESIPPSKNKRIYKPVPTDSLDSARIAHNLAKLKAEMKKIDLKSFLLSKESQAYRDRCIELARIMSNNLKELRGNIIEDNQHYANIEKKLKELNDYATKRYAEIQNNIFINGGDSYFTVLKRFNWSYGEAKSDAKEKYRPESFRTNDGHTVTTSSQWKGPIVIGLLVFIAFYLVIAAGLSNVLVRWLVPKRFRTEEFMKKKVCIILMAAIVIFALVISVARIFMGTHHFMIMASGLLIEFAWLAGVILISLLVRLSGDQIKSGFRIYAPIMALGFLIIAFRIIFIPNNIVNLILPPILALFTLWQWRVIHHHNDNIPRSDIFYTWISFVIMVVSTIAAWMGYTLMSVQILIWWVFQLTCIQTITCLYDLLSFYEARYLIRKIKNILPQPKKSKGRQRGKNHEAEPSPSTSNRLTHQDVARALEKLKHNKGAYINKTWFFDFISMVLVPILGAMSIMWSILWSADVFDLVDSIVKVFFVDFISIPNIISLSLQKIVTALAMWFIFRYMSYLLKASYKKFRNRAEATGPKPNITLANNIISIAVWGTYFIICMIMLHIPAGAIETISAGLAAGLGFAMKDLLENFFYGISLMSGRVRVGDYIECDGIRGKVESITYQSTQITTADGSVIAFLNSSLFGKNFKNLTKGNMYEFVKVPVGIAYGSNVDEVRKMLLNAISQVKDRNREGRDIISTKRPMDVIFDDFGDSSVNLFFTYWVLVEEKLVMTAKVKEIIYNTLNANNIEIPFPQQDVYIKQMPGKK